MPLPLSGPLKFSDIALEFTDNPPHSIGEFTAGPGSLIPPTLANSNIQTTQLNMKLSDYYGASKNSSLLYTGMPSYEALHITGNNLIGISKAFGSIRKWDITTSLDIETDTRVPSGSLHGYNIIYETSTSDSSGNVYAVGTTYLGSSTGFAHFVLSKWDSAGTEIFTVVINSEYRYDYGNYIDVDDSGNIYICGHAHQSPYLYANVYISKLSSTGQHLWARWYVLSTWGSNPISYIKDFAVDGSGNIYYINNGWICKVNTNGVTQWNNLLNGDPYEMTLYSLCDTSGTKIILGGRYHWFVLGVLQYGSVILEMDKATGTITSSNIIYNIEGLNSLQYISSITNNNLVDNSQLNFVVTDGAATDYYYLGSASLTGSGLTDIIIKKVFVTGQTYKDVNTKIAFDSNNLYVSGLFIDAGGATPYVLRTPKTLWDATGPMGISGKVIVISDTIYSTLVYSGIPISYTDMYATYGGLTTTPPFSATYVTTTVTPQTYPTVTGEF